MRRSVTHVQFESSSISERSIPRSWSYITLALGEREERLVGALGAVVRGPPLPVLPARLVADLAAQLGVAHAAVALLDPAVEL